MNKTKKNKQLIKTNNPLPQQKQNTTTTNSHQKQKSKQTNIIQKSHTPNKPNTSKMHKTTQKKTKIHTKDIKYTKKSYNTKAIIDSIVK